MDFSPLDYFIVQVAVVEYPWKNFSKFVSRMSNLGVTENFLIVGSSKRKICELSLKFSFENFL